MDALQEKLAYWRDGGLQIAKKSGVKNGKVRTPVFDDRPGKEGRVAGWHTHHFVDGERVRTDATATPETIRTGMVTHG
jgi:hypothetical protein